MTEAEIDRERRTGRVAGILGILGLVAFLAPGFAGLGTEFGGLAPDAYAERFEAFDAERNEILLRQILQALAIMLFAVPLFFLFQAALNRSDAVRRSLIGLTVIGPLFFAISLLLIYFAYDSATPVFLEGMEEAEDVEQFAEDSLVDQGSFSILTGLQFAGVIGVVVALFYTSLQAMRAGLLSRFLGTLGMALGVGFLLLGPFAFALWVVVIAPLVAGWWFGSRPPAWDAGEAVPWPKPGETPPEPEEELASAADFEGSGRELREPPLPDAGDAEAAAPEAGAPEPGDAGDAGDGRATPRKRKQRD